MTAHPEIARLLQLNQLGLVPGPGEEAEDFIKRAEYCLNLKTHLSTELKEGFAFTESTSPEILATANEKLQTFYDISPAWIPLFFSNYKLSFWHGGCAWIFQITPDTPTAALIQLRKNLQQSPKYLGLYHRNELLTHELAHVGRMMFHEPQFEEMLAYNTTNSRFRRWFGPIIQSSMESVLFILILFLIIVFDVFLVALHRPDAYAIALWIKAVPLGLIAYALIRLWKRHKVMDSCLQNLSVCLGSESKARAVIYRLTDKEIALFGKAKTNRAIEDIKAYAEANKDKELRWKVIYNAYF